MGKGDSARNGQPGMQSPSAGLPVRAREGLNATGCNDDPATARPDEINESQDDAESGRRQDSDARTMCARQPLLRRPLTNDYKRLDNLVLLKQEIKKLHVEIKELRDGERRRLDDMRSQAEYYKAEISEISKISSRESQKLICEVRTKDRIIGRLEKEMGVLRTYYDKLKSKQKEEPEVVIKRGKKAIMPPHTAKDRAELSRVETERTLEQPPAPPEPPDIQSSLVSDLETKIPWRIRPEEKRRKLRHTGRSILEFINSELLDGENAHRTVVFIGDQNAKTEAPEQTGTEVLRIDVPPRSSLPQSVQTQTDSLSSHSSTQTSFVLQINSQCVQTNPSLFETSRSVQTESKFDLIDQSVQTVDDTCVVSDQSASECQCWNSFNEQQDKSLDHRLPQTAENPPKQEIQDVKLSTVQSPHRLPSKLPVLERSKSEDFSASRSTTNILTKVVSLETLYGVLMEEHVGLVREAREQSKRASIEKQKRSEAEDRLSEASKALESLQKANRDLEARLNELTEENDLLEFRLLEMEDAPPKRAVSRGSETTRWDITETQDDVSDSGVMSLPTSEDEQYSLCSSDGSTEVLKCRLLSMCRHTGSPTERTCLEDTIALLRHYEHRLQALDSAAPPARYGDCSENKSSRIVATVPPFSSAEPQKTPELRHGKEDPLSESGIFEESHFSCRSTQTELPVAPGDLSQEIQKLVQIRECLEESKTGPSETRELIYLRERLLVLEDRIKQYEALPEHKDTRARVELEAALRAHIKRLEERVEQLEDENIKLEEICSELEEQENDTRLRCQKLEAKVSSLGEKKIGLKAQLELNASTITELKEALMEEERKRTEARQAAARMEGLVHQYEKKNFELEERETEVRYRLQMLENTMPAIMMWNLWRMMAVMQAGEREREGELMVKLKTLETDLSNENTLLEQSRKIENELKDKVQELEDLLKQTGHETPQEGVMTDVVGKLTRDTQEKDKRIQELELREKLYQETLQQADTMFAEMESDYTKKINDKESELKDRELKLNETETKMRRLSKERESSTFLQERLQTLETELQTTKDNLVKKEQERTVIKEEEERLRSEFNTCLDEIQSLKSSLLNAKGELDSERKSTKELKELVKQLENDGNNLQQEHETEVSKYKKQIKKLGVELMESEVTISELKEEVQTLEMAVKELREELKLEKEKSESARVRLESELEESCRKIELLEGSEGSGSAKGISLRDELDMSMWREGEDASMPIHGPPIPAVRTAAGRKIKRLIEQIESSTPRPHPRKPLN